MGNEYNGWTNYETWNVALWIDNEYAIYEDRQRVRRQEGEWDARRAEEFVSNWFDGAVMPDFDESCDVKVINWSEIAENWNDEDHDD